MQFAGIIPGNEFRFIHLEADPGILSQGADLPPARRAVEIDDPVMPDEGDRHHVRFIPQAGSQPPDQTFEKDRGGLSEVILLHRYHLRQIGFRAAVRGLH
jgi:hypothetical protein